MRYTPKRAWKAHCYRCKGGTVFQCVDNECALHEDFKIKSKSVLKRIRTFCLQCVETIADVRNCDGETLNFGSNPTGTKSNPGICPLHEFRMGRNPALKGKRGNVANLKKNWKGEG